MNKIKNREHNQQLRVLIVADNVSRKMGGEAGKNLYYLQLFQERNVDVRILCHARVREELKQELSKENFKKFDFVEDSPLQIQLWKLGKHLPDRLQTLIIAQIIRLNSQLNTREVAKKIIKKHDIQLVFEPSPITPKGISCMYDLGVPVVIGPLSGGLDFPPAFRHLDASGVRVAVNLGRYASEFLHQFFPGKLQAETLIVANSVTAEALPKGCQGKIYEVIECGVDLDVWKPRQPRQPQPGEPIRFVYVGRFVDWKGVHYLLDAFKLVAEQTNAVLELVGDGMDRKQLEAQVQQLQLQNCVNFHGWMQREKVASFLSECDVFVMPSLREAGGNAVLEAMALGVPVVATNWAGPGRTVDASCGILVEPSSKAEFVQGLAEGMIRLANSPELRYQMGLAGTKRVTQHYFDWDSKCDRILEIFHDTLERANPSDQKVRKLRPVPTTQVSPA